MASDMKWVTGQPILDLACLAVTQIGEGQYVRHLLSIRPLSLSNSLSYIGLAVNFLLIESLQRFHQYYGDDLQVYYFSAPGFL
jgi:hypothetical protein